MPPQTCRLSAGQQSLYPIVTGSPERCAAVLMIKLGADSSLCGWPTIFRTAFVLSVSINCSAFQGCGFEESLHLVVREKMAEFAMDSNVTQRARSKFCDLSR
jgi:hypothetical protein